MDVILTEDVLGLGEAGQLKSVAAGYARNYLIRRGLAIPATESARRQVASIERSALKRQSRERGTAEILADKISGKVLTFFVKVGEENRLYGSITSADIAEALQAEIGEEVDRRRIDLRRPIKTLGDHPVPIRLARDLIPEVVVIVRPEEEQGTAAVGAGKPEKVPQPEAPAAQPATAAE